ncbi:hypothetical protein SSX86_022959 [Deinandra increscens subsp. villosa]|uniref:Uncharacterized protein n=1 Tax=Deinandra increscens subsp. villosa TaxID=3103831 RepID=A0AAP0CRR1_9ASTR
MRKQTETDRTNEVAEKAEEVVSTMLAKGFVLGKDALQKAKSFDEKHQLSSNASATVASIDSKMGLTEKLSTGTAAVNEKMKEVDERYKVSEATKSAMVAAEQKANNAGSALMSNKYVASGAVWIAGAFAAVTKAAEDVGSKTKEKVYKAEEEREEFKAKEKVQEVKEENEGSKTKEKVHEPAEEKEGSKTNENAKKAEEGSNKDSPVTPVKSSNENSELPKN